MAKCCARRIILLCTFLFTSNVCNIAAFDNDASTGTVIWETDNTPKSTQCDLLLAQQILAAGEAKLAAEARAQEMENKYNEVAALNQVQLDVIAVLEENVLVLQEKLGSIEGVHEKAMQDLKDENAASIAETKQNMEEYKHKLQQHTDTVFEKQREKCDKAESELKAEIETIKADNFSKAFEKAQQCDARINEEKEVIAITEEKYNLTVEKLKGQHEKILDQRVNTLQDQIDSRDKHIEEMKTYNEDKIAMKEREAEDYRLLTLTETIIKYDSDIEMMRNNHSKEVTSLKKTITDDAKSCAEQLADKDAKFAESSREYEDKLASNSQKCNDDLADKDAKYAENSQEYEDKLVSDSKKCNDDLADKDAKFAQNSREYENELASNSKQCSDNLVKKDAEMTKSANDYEDKIAQHNEKCEHKLAGTVRKYADSKADLMKEIKHKNRSISHLEHDLQSCNSDLEHYVTLHGSQGYFNATLALIHMNESFSEYSTHLAEIYSDYSDSCAEKYSKFTEGFAEKSAPIKAQIEPKYHEAMDRLEPHLKFIHSEYSENIAPRVDKVIELWNDVLQQITDLYNANLEPVLGPYIEEIRPHLPKFTYMKLAVFFGTMMFFKRRKKRRRRIRKPSSGNDVADKHMVKLESSNAWSETAAGPGTVEEHEQ